MKKFLIALLAVLLVFVNIVSAADWETGYVTRLMKLMTTDPTYTDLVMTDIDQNSIPEVFLLKKGANGEVLEGITLKNNVLTSIKAPKNITGACLQDITVYDCGGSFVYVGKEVSRYTSEILYFKLDITGDELICTPVRKSDFSIYPAIAYQDKYTDDLHTAGYPNRNKIQNFISSYEAPVAIVVKPAEAQFSVDGNLVHISGVNINNSNYYKIRDIAMILRGTVSKFDLWWNAELGLIEIETGIKYSPIGSELSPIDVIGDAKEIKSTVIIDGREKTFDTYLIDGSTYFKIRDIGRFAGFETTWNSNTGTVEIITY